METDVTENETEIQPNPLGELAGKIQGLGRVLSTPARDAGVLTLTLRNWVIPILGEMVAAISQLVEAMGAVSYQSGRALVLSERNAAVDILEQVVDLFDELDPHVSPEGREILGQIREGLMFFFEEEEGPEEEPEAEAEEEKEDSPDVPPLAVVTQEEVPADAG